MSKSPTLQLIVGLGNPVPEYRNTRHNLGSEILLQFADIHQLSWQTNKSLKCKITRFLNCSLILPLSYMNLTGESVHATAQYFHYSPESILLIHDDLELLSGKIDFKTGGGHKGHNGIRDVLRYYPPESKLQRLRIGIGRPPPYQTVSDYVLQKLPATEQAFFQKNVIQNLIQSVLPTLIQESSSIS